MAAEPRPWHRMPCAAGVADDAVHGQEIGRVVQLADQPQLVPRAALRPSSGSAVRVAARPRPAQVSRSSASCGVSPGSLGLVRVLVAQVAEVEAAARRPAPACARPRRDGGRTAAPSRSGGLRCRSAKRSRRNPAASMVQPSRMQVTTSCRMRRSGCVVQHVAGGDQRARRAASRHVGQPVQAHGIAGPAAERQRQVGAARRTSARSRASCAASALVRLVRQQDREQALAVGGQIVPVEVAAALAGPPLAERQQPAQPRPGRAVGRDRRAAAVPSRRSSRQPATSRTPVVLAASHARTMPATRVAVGDAERRQAERGGLREQLLRMDWRRAGSE